MRILNRNDIMETIGMLTDENLDVRTVTMGISLLDCIDPDGEKACPKKQYTLKKRFPQA